MRRSWRAGTASRRREQLLVIGHENLGAVREAPAGSGLVTGDLVVGIVRRADPVPCPACAVGEWDMCRNGRYTEHGITGLYGFARPRWRSPAAALVRVDPALASTGVLLEPTTIVAKAWESIDRIGARAFWAPEAVAITGAGPVGLLAALLGVHRGLGVHVFDVVHDGIKPDLVTSLGAAYHDEGLTRSGLWPDIILECTGAPTVVLEALTLGAADRITCLTGVSPNGQSLPVDVGAFNRGTGRCARWSRCAECAGRDTRGEAAGGPPRLSLGVAVSSRSLRAPWSTLGWDVDRTWSRGDRGSRGDGGQCAGDCAPGRVNSSR
jgi:threonine dehydrogenase-like Zn-dependent dehydrogenase